MRSDMKPESGIVIVETAVATSTSASSGSVRPWVLSANNSPSSNSSKPVRLRSNPASPSSPISSESISRSQPALSASLLSTGQVRGLKAHDKIAEIFGTRLNRTMGGKLATVIDRIEHGHHVLRAYFKHA